MSLELNRETVIQNKKKGIQAINGLLENLIDDDNTLKKANLFSHWLKAYARMINFKKDFDPKRNTTYKRGDVIKVNFGFRIGSEYGGLHYAIVTDINNQHSSPVLTVIPLTSNKGKDYGSSCVDLGNELYKLLNMKANLLKNTIQVNRKNVNDKISPLQAMLEAIEGIDSNEIEITTQEDSIKINKPDIIIQLEKLISVFKKELQKSEKEEIILSKIQKEISRMKSGSIAIVNQITTISKIRIEDPRNSAGVLSGINISNESLDNVNKKIQELYVFKK